MKRPVVLLLLVLAVGCAPEAPPVASATSALYQIASCDATANSVAAIWGPGCYFNDCYDHAWIYFWRSNTGRVIKKSYSVNEGWERPCWDYSPYDTSHVADIGDPWNYDTYSGYKGVLVNVDQGRYTWITTNGYDWVQTR